MTVTDYNQVPKFPMRRESPFDPAPMLRHLLIHEPVSHVELINGQRAWLVTKYADCLALLTSPAISSDVRREGFPRVSEALAKFNEGLLNHMDPPEHDVYRRMLAPEFMPKRVGRLRGEVQRLVDGFLDDMEEQGPGVDLVERLAFPMPAVVTCALLGVPYEDRDFFVSCVEAFLSPSSTREVSAAASEDLRDYLRKLIAKKDQEPGDDLISRLTVDYVRNDALGVEALVQMAQLVLVAGFDTTANMMSLGVVTLLQHPDQLAALKDDPSLMPGAIEELLRYLTIIHWGRHRVAVSDIEVGGHLIKAGDGVIIAQDAANRDPEAFDEPDEFNIRRQSRRHIAFGHGVHLCVGASLARLELDIAYTSLFRRFPDLHLVSDVTELEYKYEASIFGVHRLPVAW